MINNFSGTKIEIGNKEYTLFINRKGIVSWENITKFSKKAKDVHERYKEVNISEEEIEVTDGMNPFDYSNDEIDGIEKDLEILRDIYVKFYWIALYENHKLNISEATKLFEEAEEEYGLQQLIDLANQMIEEININKFENKTPKKLAALKPTK